MKTVYMTLSGLILSIMVTLSMAGLLSLHPIIKTTTAKNIKVMETNEQFTGMWVTKDGYIRQELLPNGRYDEARGNKKSAYTGSYIITGSRINYKDDTGFTADGEFKDGILHHGGYIFYREAK